MKVSKIIIVVSTLCLFYGLPAVQASDKWLDKILSKDKKSDSKLNTKGLDLGGLNLEDISSAFKEALTKGSSNVVSQLGKADGFNADEAIHIPLPKSLKKVRKVLKKVGMSDMVNDLETKLNRAAEAATPIAKDLFIQSIKDMTFEDVKKIYSGANDSATQYFKQKMSGSLSEKMNPIVEKSLLEVGAVKALNAVMEKYGDIPFVKSVKPDLTGHVVQKGMDGIFYYLAKQEAEIRKNPIKQTTNLLKKVFGK